jgi:hypothetical protein
MSGYELSRVRTKLRQANISQPFRYNQYNQTPNRRPMATLAMLFSRRIALMDRATGENGERRLNQLQAMAMNEHQR